MKIIETPGVHTCIYYGTNKHTCSGGGGEERSVLWGGNFNLLRHGPRQICPGWNSHLTSLMDFVEFFMVRPYATSSMFRNIKMILFRCFSSRLPQSTLVTWFWFRSPPSSAASVSLSSLSGLSFSFFLDSLHILVSSLDSSPLCLV